MPIRPPDPPPTRLRAGDAVFRRPAPRPPAAPTLKAVAAEWVARNPAAGLGAGAAFGVAVGWFLKRR